MQFAHSICLCSRGGWSNAADASSWSRSHGNLLWYRKDVRIIKSLFWQLHKILPWLLFLLICVVWNFPTARFSLAPAVHILVLHSYLHDVKSWLPFIASCEVIDHQIMDEKAPLLSTPQEEIQDSGGTLGSYKSSAAGLHPRIFNEYPESKPIHKLINMLGVFQNHSWFNIDIGINFPTDELSAPRKYQS